MEEEEFRYGGYNPEFIEAKCRRHETVRNWAVGVAIFAFLSGSVIPGVLFVIGVFGGGLVAWYHHGEAKRWEEKDFYSRTGHHPNKAPSGEPTPSWRRVVKDTGWELTDTSVTQQVTKPKRKSASQSKTPANSDPAPIREILKNHGHKLIVRNNKYFIYVDDEKYEFETESQVFRFLKTQGFI